jgi:hypothetical protein
MNIVMVLTTILVLNITIFPYAEFSRTMMAMHTQCPEVKQYVLHIICSMIRMSNFGIVYICMVSLLMYLYDIYWPVSLWTINVDCFQLETSG